MRVYLLDDEQKAITALQFLLSEYFPEVEVCGSSTHADKAREDILQLKPDLLFSDISMPFENGLEFAKSIEMSKTLVVFVTAHPNYAIDAFKVKAFDYLLKPVQIKDLSNVVQRAANVIDLAPRETKALQKTTLKIRYEGKTVLLDPKNVLYVHSEGNYSEIVMSSGKPIVLTKNIKQLEETVFSSKEFFRVHQSYIINLSKITSYSGNEATVENAVNIPVSRQKKDAFLVLMENL